MKETGVNLKHREQVKLKCIVLDNSDDSIMQFTDFIVVGINQGSATTIVAAELADLEDGIKELQKLYMQAINLASDDVKKGLEEVRKNRKRIEQKTRRKMN